MLFVYYFHCYCSGQSFHPKSFHMIFIWNVSNSIRFDAVWFLYSSLLESYNVIGHVLVWWVFMAFMYECLRTSSFGRLSFVSETLTQSWQTISLLQQKLVILVLRTTLFCSLFPKLIDGFHHYATWYGPYTPYIHTWQCPHKILSFYCSVCASTSHIISENSKWILNAVISGKFIV